MWNFGRCGNDGIILAGYSKDGKTMEILVRAYQAEDLPDMIRIWNEIVEEGVAFPQEDSLTLITAKQFFAEQTYSAVAVDVDTGRMHGLYILHPNNVGRCGHISNASFAVSAESRGRHVGEVLVRDCLEQARQCGFGILQFNAVVASNLAARHLYERLGFVPMGVLPRGFRQKDGSYEDICPYYYVL